MMNRVISVVLLMAVACGGEEKPQNEGPYTLTLTIQNMASDERVCQLTYILGEEYVTIVPGQMLAPRETREGEVTVPAGESVSISAGCWHPAPPPPDAGADAGEENPIRASTRLNTLPMRGDVTCNAIYDESNGPNMALPCYAN